MPLAKLGVPDAELDRLLVEAQKRFDALTAEQKTEHRALQRKSWVIGETMLKYPEITHEQAEELYEKVILGIGL
jgi:hypothetical protein